jgi:hypothetical protein
MKHTLFATWDTTGAVRLLNQSGSSWSSVSGLTVGSLNVSGKATLMALDASGHPYHWNVYAPAVSGTTSGQWQNCPGPGNICNPNATHTGKLQVTFPHGVSGTMQTQTIPYNGAMNLSSWDAGTECDPLFGNPNDPSCAPMSSGGAQCNQTGANIENPGTPAIPCILNAVPPRLVGWPITTHSVNVYISDHWNATEMIAICSGISAWTPFNLIAYSCQTASAPPSRSSSNYIWVSYNPAFVGAEPWSTNDPCGYYRQCPTVGGAVVHPWIQIGPFSDAQLMGVAAHEEGHDNWLENCNNCQYGGSVMGSQGTWESNQPIAPTACDMFWAAIWELI